MLQVSRDSNLKIPKKLENFNGTENSVEDIVAVKQAIATAENKRFNKKQIIENVEKDNEIFLKFIKIKLIIKIKKNKF